MGDYTGKMAKANGVVRAGEEGCESVITPFFEKVQISGVRKFRVLAAGVGDRTVWNSDRLASASP